MSKPKTALETFLASGRPIPVAMRVMITPLLHHLDSLSPAQRASVAVKGTPEHLTAKAAVEEKLGHSIAHLNPQLVKLLQDVRL